MGYVVAVVLKETRNMESRKFFLPGQMATITQENIRAIFHRYASRGREIAASLPVDCGADPGKVTKSVRVDLREVERLLVETGCDGMSSLLRRLILFDAGQRQGVAPAIREAQRPPAQSVAPGFPKATGDAADTRPAIQPPKGFVPIA